MLKSSDFLRQYLAEQHMMQLATVKDGQPWCCTVYFVTDEALNLYWASIPSRRHSRELVAHPQVAAAIAVKHVNGEPVVGIQVEGTAAELPPSPANRPVTEGYAARFGRSAQWVEDFVGGKTEHRLYRLTPQHIYLFDEVNFPGKGRQTVR